MDFETVSLPVSGKTILLVPLYGYGRFNIYNRATEEILPWEESGFYYEISNNIGEFTLDNYGTLVGKKCGIAHLSIYLIVDGEKEYLLKDQPIFVAECSFKATESQSTYSMNTEKSKTYATFAQSDKEYIAMCLDLAYSLNKVTSPTMCEVGVFGNIMNGISNFTENLAAALREGPKYNPEKEEIKRNLATVISKYAGMSQATLDQQSQAIKEKALQNTQVMITLLDAFAELEKNNPEQFNKLSNEEKQLIEELKKIRQQECVDDSRAVLEFISTFLDVFLKYKNIQDIIEGTDEWDTIEKIQNALKNADILGDLSKSIKDVDTIIGVVAEFEKITLDALIYTMYDYQANIDLLKILREEFANSNLADPTLVVAIDSLIDDYSNKWATAFKKGFSEVCAMTIVQITDIVISSAFPYYSIIKFVVESFADCSYAQEKFQLYTLSLLSSALYDTLDPIYDMYMTGKQTTTLERLKMLVSLYLNIVKDENDLAWTLWFDYSLDEIAQFGQMSRYIQNNMKVYLN